MNSDRLTKTVLFSSTLLLLIIAAGIVLSLVGGAIPAFKEFGFRFIFSNEWNPTEGHEVYGVAGAGKRNQRLADDHWRRIALPAPEPGDVPRILRRGPASGEARGERVAGRVGSGSAASELADHARPSRACRAHWASPG